MKLFKRLMKHLLGRMRCAVNGIQCQNGIYIGYHCHIRGGKNITLGENVSIRPFTDLFSESGHIRLEEGVDIGTRSRIAGNTSLGKYVLTGPDVYICSYDHAYQDTHVPVAMQGEYYPHKNGHPDCTVGDGSWIGIHAVIIGDVHIGKNCIIGANSVVTKDIPDYCLAAGAPAKILKRYDFSTKRWEAVQ